MTTRMRISVLAGIAVIAAAGLGAGVAIAATGSPGQPAAAAAWPAPAASSASAGPGYSWYRSMMGGSSYGWMMSPAGYQWMTGGTGAPGWMNGGSLPSSMMGISTDPGTIMGSLFAKAPGRRISAARAAAADSRVPAGAQVSPAGNTITFTTATVRLTVLAGTPGTYQYLCPVPGHARDGMTGTFTVR